jgi:hypothetical protein
LKEDRRSINQPSPVIRNKTRLSIEIKQELLGQFSSTVEQDCTIKKDDFRVLRKKFEVKI